MIDNPGRVIEVPNVPFSLCSRITFGIRLLPSPPEHHDSRYAAASDFDNLPGAAVTL
jgi:hypothetical protein